MLGKLMADKSKVPTLDLSEIINFTLKSWNIITVDCSRAFKQNFATNAFDGLTDSLASDKIFSPIGNDMVLFREDLFLSI